MKKTDAELTVRMVRNPDVLAALGEHKDGTFLVGFAAETDDHEANAREKLRPKQLDAIAVNDGAAARLRRRRERARAAVGKDGRRELGPAAKPELAARLLDALLELPAMLWRSTSATPRRSWASSTTARNAACNWRVTTEWRRTPTNTAPSSRSSSPPTIRSQVDAIAIANVVPQIDPALEACATTSSA